MAQRGSYAKGIAKREEILATALEVIAREAKRAWRRYGMLVLTGLEFNKDGPTRKSSAHLLGLDLKLPISPRHDLMETITRIHAQGGLAVAAHPHLGKIDEVAENQWQALPPKAPAKATFRNVIKDFYLTNPIARASAVMAELSALAAARAAQPLAAE